MESKKEKSATGNSRYKTCPECQCATCYTQEFCEVCIDCEDHSHARTGCPRYEGPYTY